MIICYDTMGVSDHPDKFVAKGLTGLTDCVWLAPGTVEMCL